MINIFKSVKISNFPQHTWQCLSSVNTMGQMVYKNIGTFYDARYMSCVNMV